MATGHLYFRDDPQLRQFYLNGVTATGKTLGQGSYGSVLEIKYGETTCAAKQIHDILLQSGNEGVREIIEKYQQECQIMAGLRHPNITQFLGLCFLEGSNLPLLVMERLEMSVHDLLACSPKIPLPVKISLLTDTSNGLVYLHDRETPIIHRDLTGTNVLLTSSLTAKITDLGNSRMVTFRPGQLAKTLTKTPGTTVYMPPEALNESHRYGPSLDVFSFGHLALFTLTQVFPDELLSSTYPNPSNPDLLTARSEVDRRQNYMATLKTTYGSSHPVLLDLVRKCLQNTPKRRPSSQDLLATLRTVKSEVEGVCDASIVKQLNIVSVLYRKETKDKDKKIQELQRNTQRLEQENRDKQRELERLQQENRDQQTKLDRLESQQPIQKETMPNQKEPMPSKLSEILQLLVSEKEVVISQKMYGEVKMPLLLEWNRGPDMPVAMDGYIQTTEINGIIYAGGGGWIENRDSDLNDDLYKVFAYNTKSGQWHTLPPYGTMWFAMTTINNKLVLVGGRNRDGSDSSELGEWQSESDEWTHPFPPMPTPRKEASITSYKKWLLVAGGRPGDRLQSVEILDIPNMQWSTGPSTPVLYNSMRSTTIGDTWYLMGCFNGKWNEIPDVYSVSLEAIVSKSQSDNSRIWKKVSSHDCMSASPLNIKGSLLAVGGCDMEREKMMSVIKRYVSETETWYQVGQLPHAVWNCTCITASDKVYVLGGNTGYGKLATLIHCDICI